MANIDNKTTSQELYNFIFEACNILRGPVSQDNFKDYITPLLYYKRISDVYDEETEEALELSGGDTEFAALPEQHRFDIPDGCHWQDVRERTENVGAALVGAMRQIELANPDTLYGVLSIFSAQKWTDKRVLSDERISNLIEHMSKIKLGNRNYSNDLMGDAYEIMLKKFADDSKAQAGEFYTARPVVKLLVQILDPKPGESVYDPACGSGGMLIESVRHMKNDSLCCGNIFGQEKNVTNAAIAKMNLFLHGASDFNILQGDTLREPKILQGGTVAKFDCVIANPPFSLFREYVAQLIEYGKKFIILGNQNAATYQDIFPLIKENMIWYGASIHSGGIDFRIPDDYEEYSSNVFVKDGKHYINLSGIRWFTNMDVKYRHDGLWHRNGKFDNTQAHCYYEGNEDKYNPDEFEIQTMTKTPIGNEYRMLIFDKQIQHNPNGTTQSVTKANDGAVVEITKPLHDKPYYSVQGKIYKAIYPRILIRNLHPVKKSEDIGY